MRTATILTALALIVGASGTASALNLGVVEVGEDMDRETVMLTSNDCLDWNVLYEIDGVHSPNAPQFNVQEGNAWSATSSDGPVNVDFFNAAGVAVGYGTGNGEVPENASYGIACVGVLGDYPDVPVPGASYTYSDE